MADTPAKKPTAGGRMAGAIGMMILIVLFLAVAAELVPMAFQFLTQLVANTTTQLATLRAYMSMFLQMFFAVLFTIAVLIGGTKLIIFTLSTKEP